MRYRAVFRRGRSDLSIVIRAAADRVRAQRDATGREHLAAAAALLLFVIHVVVNSALILCGKKKQIIIRHKKCLKC